jgi:hypothetical protein
VKKNPWAMWPYLIAFESSIYNKYNIYEIFIEKYIELVDCVY